MSLSKVIPARKVTFVPTWIKKEFLVMDQQYREIRSRMRDPMDKCHWCKVPCAMRRYELLSARANILAA